MHGILTSDGGEPCSVRFQYRPITVPNYITTAWQTNVTSGQGANAVLTAVTNLQAGVEYRYRMQAQNGVGLASSDEISFTPTPITLGTVDWISASDVIPTIDAGMAWTDAIRAIDDDTVTAARCYFSSGKESL